MKTTVFAKKRTTKEGRPFYTYSGRLTRKDGEQVVVSIKFGKDVKIPDTFPCNIDVAKESARYSEKKGVTTEGKEYTDRTLWVNAYTMGEPYVDNSCDDFED